MEPTWKTEGGRTWTIEEAMAEANRCLQCPKPSCRTGCPIENDIPTFIAAIAKGNFGEAHDIIRKRSSLPQSCGRVCPKEQQCEGHCIMHRAKKPPIQIGMLEAFVTEFIRNHKPKGFRPRIASKGRVAVVGSGPAGLSAARRLASAHYTVEVFESMPKPGGLLRYGIPEFRYAKHFVDEEIAELEEMGVTFTCNTQIGVHRTIAELWEEGFEAIFLGIGTTIPTPLSIPNIEQPRVLYALSFLIDVQRALEEGEQPLTLAAEGRRLGVQKGDRVLVIGAGNVAMDAARMAQRLGGETTVVYRRGPANMSCLPSEYEEAVEEGVGFAFYSAPIEVVVDEEGVRGLRVEKQDIQEDGSMVATGIYETYDADVIIVAIGYKPDTRAYTAGASEGHSIAANRSGYIQYEEHSPYWGMTTWPGVFAAGDAVHEPATVVLAMKEGKKVASSIIQYLEAQKRLEKNDSME